MIYQVRVFFYLRLTLSYLSLQLENLPVLFLHIVGIVVDLLILAFKLPFQLINFCFLVIHNFLLLLYDIVL